MTDYFPPAAAATYDEKNRGLAPIAENMHFLIRLILRDLPDRARVLCVGVGTGAEIVSLAAAYPTWTFVGVDPSSAMLEVCRQRLMAAGVLERCELVHGYVKDVTEEEFDAVIAVLVGHFVPRNDRSSFYGQMVNRLQPGGYLITTELSFDLDSKAFPSMMRQWEAVQALMGATPASLAALPQVLRQTLAVLPPAEVEARLLEAGVDEPVRFFQSFMISGWYGRKG